MSRYFSYLNTAREIITTYRGEDPLSFFLKRKFATEKKYGAKDRKQISHLCYSFYRPGKMAIPGNIDERILTALFFCSDQPGELLQQLKPGWNEWTSLPLSRKIGLLGIPEPVTAVFPWKEELSDGISHESFCESFFMQPDLFLRLRPGKEKIVIKKLEEAAIPFAFVGDACLALQNTTQLDRVIEVDEEAVIQDYNSQKTGGFLRGIFGPGRKISVWDCCAASGGKSIMAKDLLGSVDLTVSDVRESILANLQGRFKKAGIEQYHGIIADLSRSSTQLKQHAFDLVIADVPCSGSGTWGRTPEQLYYFDPDRIETYASLQKKILGNVVPHIKPGGYLLYITCSVFRKENEEAVRFMEGESGLTAVSMELLKGYDKKADTLFAALLAKT